MPPQPLFDVAAAAAAGGHNGSLYPHQGMPYHPVAAGIHVPTFLPPSPPFNPSEQQPQFAEEPVPAATETVVTSRPEDEVAIEDEYVQVSSAGAQQSSEDAALTGSAVLEEEGIGLAEGRSLTPRTTTTTNVPIDAAAGVAIVAMEMEDLGSKSYSDIVKRLKAAPHTPDAAVLQQKTVRSVVNKEVGAGLKLLNTTENSGVLGGPQAVKSNKQNSKQLQQKKRENRTAAAGDEDSLYTLYVNQLPPGTTVAELQRLFNVHGPIRAIDLLSDRGFAFVKFETLAGLQGALVKK